MSKRRLGPAGGEPEDVSEASGRNGGTTPATGRHEDDTATDGAAPTEASVTVEFSDALNAVGGHDGTLHSVTPGVAGFTGTAYAFTHGDVAVPSAAALVRAAPYLRGSRPAVRSRE